MKRLINSWKSILIIICLALLVWLVTSSCNVKKHVQKSEEKTEINSHVTETATLTTIESGTFEIKADSSENVQPLAALLEEKPLITETDNFIVTTTLNKLTKTVKTKIVQKAAKVPILRTSTEVRSKTSDTNTKTEKKQVIRDKKVSTLPWWLWLIIAIALIYGCWKISGVMSGPLEFLRKKKEG